MKYFILNIVGFYLTNDDIQTRMNGNFSVTFFLTHWLRVQELPTMVEIAEDREGRRIILIRL